jgi:hypothetical protein
MVVAAKVLPPGSGAVLYCTLVPGVVGLVTLESSEPRLA